MTKEAEPSSREMTIFVVYLLTLISFIIGLGDGSNGCTYESIISRVAIPYMAGCELARPRFKPFEKSND